MSGYYDTKLGRWISTSGPRLVAGRWVERRGIATDYAGTRFRSRLEARWAFVFDQLGIRWTYEPKTYRLSSGAKYLPDFFLPAFFDGVFVEVKPQGDDFVLARQFSLDALGRVLLAEGHPRRQLQLLAAPTSLRLDLVSEPALFDAALSALRGHHFQDAK